MGIITVMDKLVVDGPPRHDLGIYAHLPQKIYSEGTECPVCGKKFSGNPKVVRMSHWMMDFCGLAYRLKCERCSSVWLEAFERDKPVQEDSPEPARL